MSNRSIGLDDAVYQYLLNHSLQEHPVLQQCRLETAGHALARMQIAPEQGQFMQLLVRLLAAKRLIEVGVFTGYSALAMALALPADGRLVACDNEPDYTRIAERYWQQAGVREKIELHLAPAIETLNALKPDHSGQFDMAFIDADKPAYLDYYEACLQLLRPGGVIVVDNVLWSGRVAEPGIVDEDTCAIRAFNSALQSDERVHQCMLPLADGVTVVMKKLA